MDDEVDVEDQNKMNEKRRVKLYLLVDGSGWDDRGTGYVEVAKTDNGHSIIMRSDVTRGPDGNPEVLLNTRISKDDIYQRQQEALIVWNDPFLQQDIALSFQIASGCASIWQDICVAQQRPCFPPTQDDNELDDIDSSSGTKLPEPSISNLPEILAAIQSAPPVHYARERLVQSLLSEGYIDKLLEIHEQCEDLDDLSNLHKLFTIFKSMVLLNWTELLKALFDSTRIMKVIATLEFDPDLPNKELHHRKFLETTVKYKQLLQLPDTLQTKIHKAFRIQYIKETVLARCLDDPTFTTINTLLINAHNDILGTLYKDEAFLGEVFELLNDSSSSADENKIYEATLFLQEMTSLAKTLTPQSKSVFFMTLGGFGFFSKMAELLASKRPRQPMVAADILWQSANQDPAVMRACAVCYQQKDRDYPFLTSLTEQLLSPHQDESMKGQLTDILKLLLDGDVSKQPELNDMLRVFYDTLIDIIIAPLSEPTTSTSTLFYQLELLGSCISHHTYRITSIVLHHNVIAKAINLISDRKPEDCPIHLTLAIIRFMKCVVLCKNEEYNRHIARNNLFAVIVDLFEKNGRNKYNLANSAIISIFEFVRRENVKVLVAYIVDSFWERLKDVHYVDTFQKIYERWEQNVDRDRQMADGQTDSPDSSHAHSNVRRMVGGFSGDLRDDDDEGYLFGDDPEPEDNGAKAGAFKLVVYDDEEDEAKKQQAAATTQSAEQDKPKETTPTEDEDADTQPTDESDEVATNNTTVDKSDSDETTTRKRKRDEDGDDAKDGNDGNGELPSKK
eukprot:TRINITY_DN12127_c0_g1_i1.p1 TRINITY_DN12127_c0_g1~~TRINITY_DN12127_c0_g1_i1.p1  ORF type:complete len:790 (+),score=88.55 TRINITY_DN12127_c0_g1_i1:48-2417(+)